MIPKKIHYCWVGNNPLPQSAKKCIESWKKYCPDYEIIQWDENNYDFGKIPYMKEAYEVQKWGFVPDYARLVIIYTHGGIYLDVDVEVIKPLDSLLAYNGFVGFESDEHIAFGLGFGAEKGNKIIKIVRDSYIEKHFVDEDGNLDLTPSPTLNTETMKKIGAIANGEKQVLEGFAILPTDYLCPKSFYDGVVRLTSNTYSIHHYDASWYTEKQQREKEERWKRKQKEYKKKRVRKAIGNCLNRLLGEENAIRIKKALGLIK